MIIYYGNIYDNVSLNYGSMHVSDNIVTKVYVIIFNYVILY